MTIQEVEKLLGHVDWNKKIPKLECSIIDIYDDLWFQYLWDNFEFFRTDDSDEYFLDQDEYCNKYGLPTFAEYLILSGKFAFIKKYLMVE